MQAKLNFCLFTIFVASSLLLFNPAVAQPPAEMGARPDFSEAAEALGITEDQLLSALGGPPPNFSKAAEKLGISEEKLTEVLPVPHGSGPPR